MPADTDQIADEVISFGPFRLLPARRRLERDGAPVPLGDRALEILLVLIDQAPAVVSKDILLARAWPGVTVEETNLRFQMSALRKALGDDRFITTVMGRGYCFVEPFDRSPASIETPVDARSVPRLTPLSSAPVPNTNLPARLSKIIGRSRELAELTDWLSESRHVTLVGSGGVGKTRLAIEIGWRCLETSDLGVWLIDLAPLTDGDAIASLAADLLGVPVEKTSASEALASALRRAPALLIFDNCEHLSAAAAALIKILLERAPSVSILATSQKILHLEAERVFSLDPLEAPRAEAADVSGAPAVELFAQRARAADRTFELDESNTDDVGEICRQLDGLPLAIEMAAARLRMLGVAGLRRGLTDRLKLLKATQASQARHASLHSMLEWSHSLLSPLDQRVFRHLGVFPGPFALDAAVAVASEDKTERWDVVDALGRLIEQSLVTMERREPAHYRLLETVRLYATDKLSEAGETDVLAERHARHVIDVFDAAELEWEETPELDWIVRYRPELDSLRTALDWALATADRSAIALALAASGCAVLFYLSMLAEGRAYLDRVLPLLNPDTPEPLAARVWARAADFHLQVYDANGLAFAERSLTIHRAHSDNLSVARVLLSKIRFSMRKGQKSETASFLLETRELTKSGPYHKARLGLALSSGLASYFDGDMEAARQYFIEAQGAARRWKPTAEILSLSYLALVEYTCSRFDRAVELAQESISLARRFYSFVSVDVSASKLANLGAYLIAQDNLAEARVQLEEAFAFVMDEHADTARAIIQIWAALAGIEGRLAEAAQLIGFVDAYRANHGLILEPAERPLYDRLTRVLDAGLPPSDLNALKARGATWSEAEAIQFVSAQLLRSAGHVTPA